MSQEIAAFRFAMSDHNWRQIAEPVRLPDGARPEIEASIGMFRMFVGADKQRRPQAAKKQIESAILCAQRLSAALNGFGPEAFQAMIPPRFHGDGQFGRPSHPLRELERLDGLIRAVEELATWLPAALPRVERKPTRDRGNLVWLVKQLDQILGKHTGAQISRSEKSLTGRFVDNVVAVAACEIGAGAVEEAMKAAIASRRRGAITSRSGA